MSLPSDDVVSRVMHFLVDKYSRGNYRLVSVDELKADCDLNDEEYRIVFHRFFQDKIFEPKGEDRLWMNEVVGAYAPRLGHCTLNDVLQFSRNHHHRDRMRRLLPAIAAWKRKQLPTITIKGLLDFGGTVDDGKLVRAVALPWFEIMKMIEQDPDSIYQIDPFKWEEIIAGAYAQAGFDEVVLTPRSGDNGRDIVATKNGIGSIRIFDQMKAYAPDRVVPANDVRALIGTITGAGNVSKGIVTTTSDFAPHLLDDPYIKSLVPHRLELKPRDALLNWLGELSTPAGTE